jgi:hypothetical protein
MCGSSFSGALPLGGAGGFIEPFALTCFLGVDPIHDDNDQQGYLNHKPYMSLETNLCEKFM